jgi:hypothetical protein
LGLAILDFQILAHEGVGSGGSVGDCLDFDHLSPDVVIGPILRPDNLQCSQQRGFADRAGAGHVAVPGLAPRALVAQLDEILVARAEHWHLTEAHFWKRHNKLSVLQQVLLALAGVRKRHKFFVKLNRIFHNIAVPGRLLRNFIANLHPIG